MYTKIYNDNEIINRYIEIEKNSMIINFITNNDFDVLECEEYYFTKKTFKSIKLFCVKIKSNYKNQ